MPSAPICLVLASDSNFFEYLRSCLESIYRFPAGYAFDIKVIAIDMTPEHRAWLQGNGIEVFTDLSGFPQFANGQKHYVAMTCRPYIPETFPGYAAYVWIDSDIRFLQPDGLRFYMEHALNPDYSVVIAHEAEATYSFNAQPLHNREHHAETFQRLSDEFGVEIAQYFQYYNMHNAGLFAARADSPLWAMYKRNLSITMPHGVHWGREQDAMNVALIEVGGVKEAPPTFNWLCRYSMPVWNAEVQAWVTPQELERKINVAHLVNSTQAVTFQNRTTTMYEVYKAVGLLS